MASVKQTSLWLTTACAIVTFGCEAASHTESANPTASVQVVYESEPLANVQIMLKQTADGPALTHAISDRLGVARFKEMPEPEPAEYVIAMESLSDGGWILDRKVVGKFCDSLRLKPFSQSPNQIIELPKRAVQLLSPTN
ncbi:hypothetical protein [Rhodopirellula sallentina]|uniref:Signal peptide protein n=1 Tax=Rhodopirellula sallentina SM41 TaxID=1263870 RepID=M5UB53_9BACT|nr:hypothetical protein [Rhodopirellula sallentina]EMI58539.1 signal peptide protein [Rhodopirellula sallentina SM41]